MACARIINAEKADSRRGAREQVFRVVSAFGNLSGRFNSVALKSALKTRYPNRDLIPLPRVFFENNAHRNVISARSVFAGGESGIPIYTSHCCLVRHSLIAANKTRSTRTVGGLADCRALRNNQTGRTPDCLINLSSRQ